MRWQLHTPPMGSQLQGTDKSTAQTHLRKLDRRNQMQHADKAVTLPLRCLCQIYQFPVHWKRETDIILRKKSLHTRASSVCANPFCHTPTQPSGGNASRPWATVVSLELIKPWKAPANSLEWSAPTAPRGLAQSITKDAQLCRGAARASRHGRTSHAADLGTHED